MLRTLIVSALLAIILSPVTSFSQTPPPPTFPSAVQADALWPTGDLGLSLTGAGYNKIGMWNGGYSHPYGHNEYSGRMTIVDPITIPWYRDHDTQTAGIVVASGFNPAAKGVAFEAELQAYDQLNITTEISTAVANGMEIGSLSYGYTGYSYDNEIDEIAYNDLEQNFLFFQAAGNGTDLYGQGKNILSVGSINIDTDLVTSSVGPATDGRIKPDLVGPGGPLWSCIGTTSDGYAETGAFTSFSAPTVAGVGVLLQQHFRNINSTSMSASTLKGVLIHTADDRGTVGPDSESGWGYVNARSAAELITLDGVNANVIVNDILNDGGTFRRETYSDGTEPLKVTLTWTDPPTVTGAGDYAGTVPTLVNDLDLVLLKDGVPTHYPWVLSDASAVQAENNLDNVVQVLIASPTEGLYTIYIDHDGVLSGGAQNFSLIITGDSEEPTPKALKQDVLAELQSDYPVENKKVDKDLKKAIEHLEKSLETGLWEDDFYLTDKGKKVFTEEMLAVKKLMDIIKEKNTNVYKAEALEAILKLVDIDETLAQLMIDKAIDNSGDSKEIEKSIVEMEKAQEEIGEGDFDKAINNYKIAWEHACLALKKVGLAKYSTASDMAEAVIVETPASFSLGDNYPNPFNPTTTISFNVPEYSKVSIGVYNLMGEKIRTLVADSRAPGNYQVNWDGTDNYGNAVSTGMYFYELKAGDFKQVKRMTFMK